MTSTWKQSLLVLAGWLCWTGCGGELVVQQGLDEDLDSLGRALGSPRVAALDASPFGVNSHAAGDAMLERLGGIGIRWHRLDMEWSHVERVEGVLDWALTDRLMDTADRLGLQVFVSVAYTPAWAAGGADHALPPKDPARYVAFVREVVRRYRGRIECIGIWNEPNLQQFWRGGRQQFIDQILVPGLQAIREEAPELATCGPDLSSSGKPLTDWMGPILASPAGAMLDVITHHQYDGKDTVQGRVARIKELRSFLVQRGHGDKPVWITETGWDTPRFSEAFQSSNLAGMMAAMQEHSGWWHKTFWYDSHGPGWGLLEPDGAANTGAPRQSFFAYRDVIAESPWATPVEPTPPPTGPDVLEADQSLWPNELVASPSGQYWFVYQGDGNLVLYDGTAPLWSSATHGSSPGRTMLQSDGNLVVYDADGAPVWHARTHDNPGAWLRVQDAGRVVVCSATGSRLWSTDGAGDCAAP